MKRLAIIQIISIFEIALFTLSLNYKSVEISFTYWNVNKIPFYIINKNPDQIKPSHILFAFREKSSAWIAYQADDESYLTRNKFASSRRLSRDVNLRPRESAESLRGIVRALLPWHAPTFFPVSIVEHSRGEFPSWAEGRRVSKELLRSGRVASVRSSTADPPCPSLDRHQLVSQGDRNYVHILLRIGHTRRKRALTPFARKYTKCLELDAVDFSQFPREKIGRP